MAEREREERGEDETRELVRAALEAAGIAAVLSDQAGELLGVTPAAQALLGDAALARNEDDLLARIAARAAEPKSLADLREQAEAGGARIAIMEDGALRLERREIPEGLHLWLVAHEEDGEGVRRRQEILGIASHDMRSPLANIRSYAGMILGGKGPPLDPRIKRAAQVIAKNADRGLRLVDDIIDLRRADEKQLTLERTNVPLEEVLRLAFEEVRTAATDKGVRLAWSAQDGLPILSVDEDKMRRAVRALLEAAVRRTPTDAEVRLIAEARSSEIFIAVEDDGDRPSVQEAALAFDRDHQTITTRKLTAGISVALAQEVVRAHGGRVGCVPRGNVGAMFYLVLPR
ncbi:sensor histidine kinase [Vulgatibacter sp.]|uniref:sensor histidine kinase n=1 Tax=Vulgatibacter sp. TaxID=1971226 RepID=UPI003568D15D